MRQSRRLAACLLVALMLAGPRGAGTSQEPARAAASDGDRKPNVVIILTDDQRTESVEDMPEVLRRFGEKGVRFSPAFVTTPLCCPSRASIFSGRYMHNHGVRTNFAGDKLDMRYTIQRYLDDAGYRTALFGKFLNGWSFKKAPPSFDRYAVSDDIPYEEGRWNVNGTIKHITKYSTDFLRKKAVKFLRQSDEKKDGRPFFLLVSTIAPHRPFTPEPDYEDAAVSPWEGNPAVFESDRSDKPDYVRSGSATFAEGSEIRTSQQRTLMSVDDLVREITQELGDLDESRRTLAFFLSDNGFLWGEHGLTGKSVPYEPSISVPFFMRWPKHLENGTIDDRWAANIDIAPTILDAAGIQPSGVPPMDGRSLLGDWRRSRILTEYSVSGEFSPPKWASTRARSYQYTEYFEGSDIVFREYYDLASDPWQLVNLLRDGVPGNDPEVAKLHKRLNADKSCKGAADCP